MKIVLFCILFIGKVIQNVTGVIYRLNASEYARFPELFSLDHYHSCLLGPGDTYCYVDARLVANESNQLFTVIQEYSSYNKTHFDHTVVHRGLCVTQTCRHYLEDHTDLIPAIEACLNATLYKSHGFQARVVENQVYCTKFDEPAGYDAVDYTIALLGLGLLVLNMAGSLFDYCSSDDDKNLGGKLLICFSLSRNMRRLLTTSDGTEPRLNRLKCFTGLRTITSFCVIMAHSPLNAAISTTNPEYLENVYHNVGATFMFNGTLIVQTFFIISGFLLAYNLLLMEEKRKISWGMLPKGIVIRWLRLTPANAAVLAFICTWQRHLGSGPLWKSTVGEESAQCRSDWFYSVLYINNYVDNSDCMMHTWYLGADMQLTILGLVIISLITNPKIRKIAVGAAFTVGLLTPAIHTAVQNLSPILIISPEIVRNIFVRDPTFNHLYKRGHTNIVNYAIGLALAMVVYHLQQKKFEVAEYKKYIPLYYSLPVLATLTVLSGCVLYVDGIQIPLAASAVYASAVKPLYGLTLAGVIGGAIFKFENFYRRILEWRGLKPLGRLSYAAFLVHFSVIRTVTGASAVLAYNSFNQMTIMFLGVLCMSYVIAIPLWLMIEAPVAELVKVIFHPKKEKNVMDSSTNLDHKETITIIRF